MTLPRLRWPSPADEETAAAGTTDRGPVAGPDVPLGTLICALPGRLPFRYAFTPEDALTTARFLVGEAGGRDNAENRGTLWAMLNRYAFFRPLVPGWGSFAGFLRQYSQTLQPFIRHWSSVKSFVGACNSRFDNPGCQFRPTRTETYPGTTVPMGQLRSFLKLQATAWDALPVEARRLALATLRGEIPNPVGNATEVADTTVYFRRAHGRTPTRAEWETYTRAFAAGKGWDWRPQQVAYDQYRANALFVTTKARRFPEGATRIQRPTGAAPSPLPAQTPTAGDAEPAPGTVETRRSFPTHPPLRSQPGARSPALYNQVLDQFAVHRNPRYAHRNGATFCNIFVWDVTRAMSCEIPHWVTPAGDPAAAGKGNELNANDLNAWLHQHGVRFGWQRRPLADAVAAANQGCPVVASWANRAGIGHIAMVRPGLASPTEGPWLAQAGAVNANRIRMFKVWKRSAAVETWVHA